MNNFIYHNPTKLVFGKGQIARLGKLIPADKKIMITFGGGSVRRNGVYDQVVKALEGRDWSNSGASNPIPPSRRSARPWLWAVRTVPTSCWPWAADRHRRYETLAAGLLYDGDPWDIVLKGQADKTVPLAPSSRCRPRVRR